MTRDNRPSTGRIEKPASNAEMAKRFAKSAKEAREDAENLAQSRRTSPEQKRLQVTK